MSSEAALDEEQWGRPVEAASAGHRGGSGALAPPPSSTGSGGLPAHLGLQLRVLRRAGTAQHAFKGHGQAGESVQLNVWVPFGQLLGAQVPWIEAAVQDSGQEQELRLMSAALTAGGGGKGCPQRRGECPPCKG